MATGLRHRLPAFGALDALGASRATFDGGSLTSGGMATVFLRVAARGDGPRFDAEATGSTGGEPTGSPPGPDRSLFVALDATVSEAVTAAASLVARARRRPTDASRRAGPLPDSSGLRAEAASELALLCSGSRVAGSGEVDGFGSPDSVAMSIGAGPASILVSDSGSGEGTGSAGSEKARGGRVAGTRFAWGAVNRGDRRILLADFSAAASAASVICSRSANSASVTPCSPVAALNDRGGADRFLFE